MIEVIVGIIGVILLYFLGQILYPETSDHKEIIPEPWQLDFQRHEKNRKEAQEDE
tara:strand:+ start:838 stop:1002 length:165 start_codon:yes stop_codon:yes gene_type:complete